jgi:hypothetical protein
MRVPSLTRSTWACLTVIAALSTLGHCHAQVAAGPVKVEIRKEDGRFQLYRGGKPYFIKGAVHTGDQIAKFPFGDIAARGGNSVRSRGSMLDEAQKAGLTVLVNLPMQMEYVTKFDYSNQEAVRTQFEEMKKLVLQYKDHPAVLMWAIGNELAERYTNKKVWDAVNQVSRMIHEVDPNHPTMTVAGGIEDVKAIMQGCPDLDLLGINNYRPVERIPAQIRAQGWEKPYVVTEWGPSGDWEVPKTDFKSSIEETSTEKAQLYLQRYQNVMLKDNERCLGSYVFIWHWRHERTQTWYGMFLESGERTEAVNVMQYVWSGKWPANRAPRVDNLVIDGKPAGDSVHVTPGSQHLATLRAEDPDGDGLTFQWEILAEVGRGGYAGRGEGRSKPMPEVIKKAEGAQLTFTAPELDGAYRVFVFVRDGRGNGATANIPFFVQP